MLHVFSGAQALYSSCSYDTQNPQILDDFMQQHSEDMPNCPSPSFSASNNDASWYTTPVACRMPTQLTASLDSSSEPLTPHLQSISATPGFSAFTPVCGQSRPPQRNSDKSPLKASFVLSYMC